RTFGSLPVRDVSGTHTFAKVGLAMMDELPKKHTLRDGISALIQSAASGEHYLYAKKFDVGCSTTLEGHPPWAEIYAAGDMLGAESKLLSRPGSPQWKRGGKPLPSESDLLQQRRITYRTIRALASLPSAEKIKS